MGVEPGEIRPRFMYGTAWKEERTAACVLAALEAGFRAIDTANQRKHYHEAAVGAALARAYERGLVTRDQLFLQTKFTYQRGQDHRLPYDPKAPIADQVAQSFARSLEHLGAEVIDAYLLHGPAARGRLIDDDWQAWRAMEALQRAGRARFIGISNVEAGQLKELLAEAEVRPAFVQNRCYASAAWDREVRELCVDAGVTYQGFSLLTANRALLRSPELAALARARGAAIPQLIFRFCQALGMLPLTGTTDPEHMRLDLDCEDIELERADLELILRLGLEA